ncbi:hypothetical protein QP580_03905 [Prevotella bivia]|uniref:hypothetical protein n=1 Tax=Prevotella bivia TaxID=28125 RepID=UPI0025503126|nr:hypothetical protein [Prevotella bivia]MDK7762599.1 hypothetical protein [Prevotella bivia]
MEQITKDSIEQAYCFFHQKYCVYAYSDNLQQKDDIEYAISLFIEGMNQALYKTLSAGKDDFLLCHASFSDDIKRAVGMLENML